MPKRIVIKGGPREEKEKQPEPEIEPVEEEKELPEVTEIPESQAVSEQDREIEEATINVEAAYETVMEKIEEVRIREKVTQQRFMEQEEMTLSILKKLLQKWDMFRDEALKSINDAIEGYNRLKALLESKFSTIEEELYFNQIELDTLRQLEEQGKPISVSKKEELEKKVPELRKSMAELNKKMEEIDGKIAELRHMADNIYEVTSYRELADKLLREMVDMYYDRLGEDAEVKLRTQIDTIAQREGIPREYATIYVWKRLRKAAG